MAAFKTLVALAIQLELEPSTTQTFPTKWNAGSLQDLLTFVQWYKIAERPAWLAERLADAALDHVRDKVELQMSVSEIFELES